MKRMILSRAFSLTLLLVGSGVEFSQAAEVDVASLIKIQSESDVARMRKAAIDAIWPVATAAVP